MESVPVKPGPAVIVLRVVVRAPDLDAFITNYSRFIDGDRIFIFTKNPQKPGTRVRFSLHLANGELLIHGKGTVTRVQEATGDRTRPPGMELVFVAIDPRSQTLVDFMQATRTGQVDEVADVPSPSDVANEPSVSAPPPLPMPPSTETLRAEALKRAVLRSGRPAPPAWPTVSTGPEVPPSPSSVVDAGWSAGNSPAAPPPESAFSPANESAAVAPAASAAANGGAPASDSPAAGASSPASAPSSSASSAAREAAGASSTAAGAVTATGLGAAGASSTAGTSSTAKGSLKSKWGKPSPGSPFKAALAFSAGGSPTSGAAAVGAEPSVVVDKADDDSAPSLKALRAEQEAPTTWDAPATVETPMESLLPPGPTPAFAEGWREPLPPGQPGADPSRSVPANPFSEVSDGAIDYFVEWSLEQSIGPRGRDSSAQFSNVEMALPNPPEEPAPPPRVSRRQIAMLLAIGAAAGLPVGAGAMWAASRHPAPPVSAAAPVTAPPPVVAAAPQPAEPAPPATGELVVASRPSGASVLVDGEPKGTTPLTLSLPLGAHQVKLLKERYASSESSVKVPGDLQVDLKRPVALLEVSSQPPGATVVVGGEQRGRTPAQIKLPAYEQYDVQVALGPGKPWRKKVYLKSPSLHVVAVLSRRK